MKNLFSIDAALSIHPVDGFAHYTANSIGTKYFSAVLDKWALAENESLWVAFESEDGGITIEPVLLVRQYRSDVYRTEMPDEVMRVAGEWKANIYKKLDFDANTGKAAATETGEEYSFAVLQTIRDKAGNAATDHDVVQLYQRMLEVMPDAESANGAAARAESAAERLEHAKEDSESAQEAAEIAREGAEKAQAAAEAAKSTLEEAASVATSKAEEALLSAERAEEAADRAEEIAKFDPTIYLQKTDAEKTYTTKEELAESEKRAGETFIKRKSKSASEWEDENPVLAVGELGYDTTNKTTKIGDGVTKWNNLPFLITSSFDFANASWAEIAEIAAAGTAQKRFAVGDEKTITLTTGEEVTLVILGFDHDDLTSGGKASITIGMKNCLATTYPMGFGSGGNWDSSTMRNQTMATLFSQLPPDLQGIIKSVDKKSTAAYGSSYGSLTTSRDKLFLFSVVEISGSESSPGNGTYVKEEGMQYEYWRTIKDGAGSPIDRIKYLSNGLGAAAAWWSRTNYSSSYYNNCYMFTNVGAISSNSNTYTYGVSFGFCI